MFKNKNILYLIVAMLFLPVLCNAQVSTYRDAHIENNALTGRGMAMGGAVSAISDNPDGLLLNPASMAGCDKYRLVAKSETGLMDVNRGTALVLIPLNREQVLGVAYSRIGVENIKIAKDTGTAIEVAGIASYAESGLFLGYSYQPDKRWALGITLKSYENVLDINSSLYEYGNAKGTDIDVGTLYRMNGEWTLSAGFRNLASALSTDGTISWDTNYRESNDFGP